MKPNTEFSKVRAPFAIVFAVAALLALPLIAQAAHWPNFGGDAGHSGNQPVHVAELPTALAWTAQDAGTVRNSIVTTAGPDAPSQFLAYGKTIVVNGTSNDRAEVNLRKLDDGTHKIAAANRDVDDGSDDTDAFGAAGEGVSFVDTSSSEGPGQLFVVHNDSNAPAKTDDDCPLDDEPASSDNDIAIAHYDEATGTKKGDFAVGQALGETIPELCSTSAQVSQDYTIESSPIITPPLGSDGTRWIYFIAKKDTAGPARLFGVRVNNAGSASAVVVSDTPQIRDIADANTLASPTLLYLNTPDQLAGGTTLYVAVSVNGGPGAGDIRTFQVGDIGDPSEDGPAATGFPGIPQTVSVPVAETGQIPGQGGSGAVKAPALYAAFDNGDNTTTVRKFVQSGASGALTEAASSTPLEGKPAPALALDVLSGENGEIPGRVVVTTDKNMILLNSATMAAVDRLADTGETLGAGDAFSRTTAMVSGDLIFVTNDDGTQAVLDIGNAEPVSSGFSQNEANQGADLAIGQPAYSRGFLQFLTDRGVFVYRTGVVIPPNNEPTARFTATPNPAAIGQQITFDASASSDPEGKGISKYEWDFDGNGTYEVDRGSDPKIQVAFPASGTFTVGLRVTDVSPADGAPVKTGATTGQVVISPPPPNQPPTATFTFTPAQPKVDDRVTFDASASKDPEGAALQRFEWDLDGNGTFETNSANNPRVQRSYSRAAVYNVKLRVTDAANGATEVTRQVVVGGGTAARKTPRRLTAKVTPRRDTVEPYVFRTTGRLTRPSGVSRRAGCTGRVTVTVKAGKKTISRRTSKLRSNCTYRTRVTFRDQSRVEDATSLRFIARFQGNKVLRAKQAKTVRRRIV